VFRIADGAYYEAHQQLRVIAARYIKQSNYDAAAEILAGGAKELLKAGSQQGASASGGDLAIMLVLEVYNKAEWEIKGGSDDAEGRARKSESTSDFTGLTTAACNDHRIRFWRLALTYSIYRAPDRATAGIPIRRAYTEEIYSGNYGMEWKVRASGEGRPRAASCCWLSICRR
jgi:hypothetical protein